MIKKSTPHESAWGHVTGQSEYVDDRPFQRGELLVGVIGSPTAAGELLKIDFTEALKVPGIVNCFSAKDLAHNRWGSIFHDQPLLVDREISHYQEPLGIMVGETEEALRLARKKVQIQIAEKKPVLTLDEAREKQMFLYRATDLHRGNVTEGLSQSPHRLKGKLRIDGQEHFYLESQAAIAYPLDGDRLEVHSSTQHPTETQHIIAEAVGLPYSKVVCTVKRLGGGFGGKESQAAPFAALAGFAAMKTKRPCRLVLTKDEDMVMTGKRHPFEIHYEVGFDDQGKILALRAELYSDGGAYVDLSPSILERAMFHIDGAYYIPHILVQGVSCKTNTHSNTAFRGFGGPQGTFVIESIIEDIGQTLQKDPAEIRLLNCYGKSDHNVTHYGQKVQPNPLPDLFSEILSSSDYKKRRAEIRKFNQENRGRLRGLSCTATKFGIAFTAKFLNQGNALVHIHRDATVQVSTGAIEMGQGVYTKVAQTVCQILGLEMTNVQVMPTSTDKNANTSPTAASSGADINCGATKIACEALKKRLAWVCHQLENQNPSAVGQEMSPPPIEFTADQYRFQNQTIENLKTGKIFRLPEIVEKAYLNRLSLSEYAHYRTEGIGFDKQKAIGTPFKYFTNGVAVTEVEVDECTGQSKVIRTDILMDLGRPQNPGIDRGQVVGAFVQAQGWVTTEYLHYDEKGILYSHSPTTYKIPNIQDTPRDLRVHLLENEYNSETFNGAKAVGEPPFLLGISVWTAIKNALAHRAKSNIVSLKSPATAERVLMELQRYE